MNTNFKELHNTHDIEKKIAIKLFIGFKLTYNLLKYNKIIDNLKSLIITIVHLITEINASSHKRTLKQIDVNC